MPEGKTSNLECAADVHLEISHYRYGHMTHFYYYCNICCQTINQCPGDVTSQLVYYHDRLIHTQHIPIIHPTEGVYPTEGSRVSRHFFPSTFFCPTRCQTRCRVVWQSEVSIHLREYFSWTDVCLFEARGLCEIPP